MRFFLYDVLILFMNNLIDKTNSKATKKIQEIFPKRKFFQPFFSFIEKNPNLLSKEYFIKIKNI